MRWMFFLLASVLSTVATTAQEELNRTWFLTSLTIDNEGIEIFADLNPYLALNTAAEYGEEVMGIAACNGYSGAATFTTDTITIEYIYETFGDCNLEDGGQFEQTYFSFLRSEDGSSEVLSYTVFDDGGILYDTLALTNENGDTATYNKLNKNISQDIWLESWYLDYFEVNGVNQSYPPEQVEQLNSLIQSSFVENGTLDQSFVCIYDGGAIYSAYDFNEKKYLDIGGITTLAMDCGSAILNAYDYGFILQLEDKIHSYEIIEEGQGRRLTLTDENGDRIFYTNAFLSTDDVDANAPISIYPNPASETLFVSMESQLLPEAIAIYNMQGQEVMQSVFSDQIDISKLTDGLYFIKFSNETKTSVYRFIKK